MSIARLLLLASVELDRMDEVQMALCSRHRDVEKAPFFVDLFRAAR